MRALCDDLVARLPQLGHIRMDRVAVAYSRTRKRVAHGLQASLTPLRFQGGDLFCRRGRTRWTIQRLFDHGNREMLYILRFYLPRFLDQRFEEKLCTVVHELWHIGPEFDGDLRRFPGRCYAHSHSENAYDELCRELGRQWLRRDPPAGLVEFLEHDFAALCQRHGRIVGRLIRAPKMLRCP